MRRRFLIFFSILGGFTLVFLATGCSQQTEKFMVGTWMCKGNIDGQTFTTETEYFSNGKSDGSFTISGISEGISVDVEGVVLGSWLISGNELIERSDSGEITKLSLLGQDIPPETLDVLSPGFRQELNQMMIGASGLYEIKKISNKELVLHEKDEGWIVFCERA